MKLFHRTASPVGPATAEMEKILRDLEGELQELMASVAAGESDIDLKIAALVEGEPEHVRMAIVEKIRDMLRAREDEKSKELLQKLEAQKRQAVEQQRMNFRQWLLWVMSEDTLRKLRESFLARPMLEGQVKNIGEELARKGVLTQIQPHSKNDLGELSANVSQTQGRTRDTGKGRL
jgi:hypothetical protein